jgi:hypothetical protein
MGMAIDQAWNNGTSLAIMYFCCGVAAGEISGWPNCNDLLFANRYGTIKKDRPGRIHRHHNSVGEQHIDLFVHNSSLELAGILPAFIVVVLVAEV